MKNIVKKYFSSFLLIVAFALSFSFVMAQQEYLPPEANGPSAREIEQFENEFGALPSSFEEEGPKEIKFEEPGKVADEVKKYVSDSELVEIYCAIIKWRTGQFFGAMNGVTKYVLPAFEKAKELGVSTEALDVEGFVANGKQRIEAICSAQTVDEAERLISEFTSWGQTVKESFDKMRLDLQAQMKEKGDALRTKVKTEIEAYVAQERAKIESEVKAEAEQLVQQKKTEIEASQNANIDVESVKAQIANQIELLVSQKKVEMEKNIRAKVDELIGSDKKKMEDVGISFRGIGQKIQTEIDNGEAEYKQYKKQAFNLRKSLVFRVLDKNIEEGLKQLDAASGDLEEARKEDSSVKTAGEIKAEIMQDRKNLETKLSLALESGDENAFQAALNDFRIKWEGYRKEAEKAASQGVKKSCTIALAQFGPARTQMDEGLGKIKSLEDKCASSTSEECSAINEFAPRFSTITGKFNDLKIEMNLAEKMCQTSETADSKNLIALMRKIQSDGEDVKVYGLSLEAEKQKVLADTGDKICAKVLPQLDAAKIEIEKNDIATLKNNLEKCKGKLGEECGIINQLRSEFLDLSEKVKEFSSQTKKVEGLCGAEKTEDSLQTLGATLNFLKDSADGLKESAKKLQAKQAEKASEKALCRAIVPSLQISKSEALKGLRRVREISLRCEGKSDEKCARVQSLMGDAKDIEQIADSLFKKITEIVNVDCINPGTGRPSQALLDKLQKLESDKDDILKKVKIFENNAEKAGVGVFFEAEDAVLYNTRVGVSNPMVKEINPSWRPPYSGKGDWYMGAGGDYLEYNFNIPSKGQYKLWIRDYKSHITSQRGKGGKTIFIDGKSIGTFPENTEGITKEKQGAFHWHQVGSLISLENGPHKFKVVKAATTEMAAVIDAFYLTTSDEIPSEK